MAKFRINNFLKDDDFEEIDFKIHQDSIKSKTKERKKIKKLKENNNKFKQDKYARN